MRLGLSGAMSLGLRAPMAVEIDESEGGVVATVLDPAGIDTFGSGTSARVAVEDLIDAMRAEASSLRARRERLSPKMANELSILDRLLISFRS